MGGLWGLLTVVGPIVLVGALVWAMLNNHRSKRAEQKSEVATSKLYDEIDREDKAAARDDA